MEAWRMPVPLFVAACAVLLFLPQLLGAQATERVLDAQQLIALSNAKRLEENLVALNVNPYLMEAAAAKAEDMAARGYFSHDTPEGESPWMWIRAEGYAFTRAGENLAVGYKTESQVIEGWLKSAPHRENLLHERFTDIGIGVAEGEHKGRMTTFVVQLLGASDSNVAEEVAMSIPPENTQETPEPKKDVAQVAAVAQAITIPEVPEVTARDEMETEASTPLAGKSFFAVLADYARIAVVALFSLVQLF